MFKLKTEVKASKEILALRRIYQLKGVVKLKLNSGR